MTSLTPLTVAEARAILDANEALCKHGARFDSAGLKTWEGLVESAVDRIAAFDTRRSKP